MSKRNQKNTKTLSEKLTGFIGSPASVVLHTLVFIGFFVLGFLGFSWDRVFLSLTTIVSLEAIYLAIFIQMSVNRNTESLAEVEEDIDEIQEDIDEIQEDVDEIQEDVEDIHDEVDELVEEEHKHEKEQNGSRIEHLEETLQRLATLIEELKKQK